jgi:hexokinase
MSVESGSAANDRLVRASGLARNFLQKNAMYPGDIDVHAYVEVFLRQMEAGLAGKPSSLRMIPTFIELGRQIPQDTPVIAVDAGGTNLRIGVVRFSAGSKPVVSSHQRHAMPGLDGEISADTFFDVFADHLSPLLSETSRVGLSFSFPAEILPNKDGRILQLCKEVRVADAAGQSLAAGLNAALRRKHAPPLERVVVLNDTVGTLLAGLTQDGDTGYSSYVGFVLGTGTNVAYVESNDNIGKRTELRPGPSQVDHVESGAYAAWPRGKIDLAFDATTADPGKYVFEKSISGAYLGNLCLRTFLVAAEAGLFSAGARDVLHRFNSLNTSALDPFLGGPNLEGSLHDELLRCGSADDIALAASLVDALVQRAAKFAAVSLGAVVLKAHRAAATQGPVCVTADGSTFYRLRSLRERVVRELDTILANHCSYRLIAVADAPLIGAAVAGLTN